MNAYHKPLALVFPLPWFLFLVFPAPIPPCRRSYIDGEGAGFTLWPTLIRPDGSFGFDMEWTTVLQTGGSRADYSTGFIAEGRIDPAAGISLEILSHTAGAADGGGDRPEIYTGIMARTAEFPNERTPPTWGSGQPCRIGNQP
jgi:hypothetical protein